MEDYAVRVDELYRHFEEVKAVDGVSFTVDKAEIFSLRERYARRRQREAIQNRRSEFAEWFEIYEELRARDEFEDSEGAIGNGVETDPVIG